MKKMYVIVYVICILMLSGFAYAKDSNLIAEIEDSVKNKKIVNEDRFTKTYKLDENTYRIIPKQNYWENGRWNEINNSIVKLKVDDFDYAVENNYYKVYFDSNISGIKEFVKIKIKSGEISFKIEDAKIIKKTKSYDNVFIYKDVYDNTTITYEVTPRKLKEYINLTQYTGKNIWTFKLNTKNLEYKLIDNRIIFTNNGVEKGVLDRPIAWDSSGVVIPCNLTLDGDKLNLIVDDEWLQNAKYPVVIDPTYDDFEYSTDYHGGANATLWAWQDNYNGGVNYYCSPACTIYDGWNIQVDGDKLQLYSTACAKPGGTVCTHGESIWTYNTTYWNATNIGNVTFQFDMSGYIGWTDENIVISTSVVLDGAGSFYSYSDNGKFTAGSRSDSGTIKAIRNKTNTSHWNVYKGGSLSKTLDGNPADNDSLRISTSAGVGGTGSQNYAWINMYVYYIDYGLLVEPNEPPVLTSIATSRTTYNASDIVFVNASGVSDNEDDMLNMTCCKGFSCTPTVSGNILTGTNWYGRNQSEYDDINGNFTAGIYAGREYVNCRLIDNNSQYSNIKSTEYNVISNYSTACDIPNTIWCEDFLYTTSFCDMGWENIPDWWGCSEGAYMPITNTPNDFYKLFQGSANWAGATGGHSNPYDFIFYHFFPETKNPIVSASWEMEIGILTTNLGATGVYFTKVLDDILALGFLSDDITYTNQEGDLEYLCTDCWSAGTTQTYKVTMYLSIGATYYDNATQEFTHYDANTFNFYIDGNEITTNKPLTNAVSDIDSFFLNRIKFYKDAAENLTLDNILIYKGTIEEYDDTYDYVETPVEVLPNGTIIYPPPEFIPPDGDYAGWKSKEDFCKNNIECCSLVNTSTGMRYLITDQICFARESIYGKYSQKSRRWLVGNQYLFFVLLIIALISIMTILYSRRNKQKW